MIIRENKSKTAQFATPETSTKLAAILKTESPHCYNHLAVIIARRENEVVDQSAHAIFDNHRYVVR